MNNLRKKSMAAKPASLPSAAVTAIGVIWGLLEQGKPEQAYQLAAGCVSCWPNQPSLRLLHGLCKAELGEAPLPDSLLNDPELKSNPQFHALMQMVQKRVLAVLSD